MNDAVSSKDNKIEGVARGVALMDLPTPQEEAHALIADPRHKLRRLLPHMGEVAGQRACSVQGSNGRVAVALALLGMHVTVLDLDEENRRYALDLAAAAGVVIDYRLGDVNEAGSLELGGAFDWIVMEGGILHYHQDLVRFFGVMISLAGPDGRLLLNEFHPVERKLFQAGVTPDYFRQSVTVGDMIGGGRNLGPCVLRHWTLGEIVTAAIDAGWRIQRLEEHPGFWAEATIPGLFTLIASST